MIKFLFSFLLLILFLSHCTIAPVIPVAIEDVVKKTVNNKNKVITSTKLIEKPLNLNKFMKLC